MTMHTMSAMESAIVNGDSFFMMIFFPFVLDMSPGTFGLPRVKQMLGMIYNVFCREE